MLLFCLNVQAQSSHQQTSSAPIHGSAAKQAVAQPAVLRAAGIAKLKQNYYGGSFYRESSESYRKEKDAWALGVLKAAGFTEADARAQMAKIRAAESAKPKPKLDPAFTRPQGQLRNGPSIDYKKKGSVTRHDSKNR